MFSRFPSLILICVLFATASSATELRVCADPDNLPFSNRAGQGFENKIAEVIAGQMHMRVHYVWARMGRGFIRNMLGPECDLLAGVPAGYKPVLATPPYYRSSYVFVTRRSRGLHLRSFDDPRLHNLKIGVQIVGEEYAPPAQALARRGVIANIQGFDSTGREARSIFDAVLGRRIDVAIVWGPLAGYFARTHRGALEMTPVEPEFDPPALPMTFAIAMGVSKANRELQQRVATALAGRQDAIQRILKSYGVPLLPIDATKQMATGAAP